MNTVPMTPEGLKMLNDELDDLISNQRPKIIEAISEARAHGDLKENAEYHSAKEKQSFIEGRIQEIENKISTAQVIDVRTIKNNFTIVFGSTIEIENISAKDKEVIKYKIVGIDESNTSDDKISYQSPLASSLLGKTQDDIVQVKTPRGEVKYKILNIKY